jgi:hypothetical protein
MCLCFTTQCMLLYTSCQVYSTSTARNGAGPLLRHHNFATLIRDGAKLGQPPEEIYWGFPNIAGAAMNVRPLQDCEPSGEGQSG